MHLHSFCWDPLYWWVNWLLCLFFSPFLAAFSCSPFSSLFSHLFSSLFSHLFSFLHYCLLVFFNALFSILFSLMLFTTLSTFLHSSSISFTLLSPALFFHPLGCSLTFPHLPSLPHFFSPYLSSLTCTLLYSPQLSFNSLFFQKKGDCYEQEN